MPIFGAPNIEKLAANKDIPSLIKALGYDKDKGETRQAAAKALAAIGSPALPGLLNAVRNPEPVIRINAAEILSRIGDPQAVPYLIMNLVDSDNYVREFTALALGFFKDNRAIQPLIQLMQDKVIPVQQAAMVALGSIGSPEVITPLMDQLASQDHNIRMAASQGLQYVGMPAFDYLIRGLEHPYENVRLACVRLLGNLADPRAAKSIVQRLADPDEYVVLAAFEALKKIGQPATIPLTVALTNSNEKLRKEAARALVKLGAMGEAPLTAAIRSNDARIREAVIMVIRQIKESWVEDPMVYGLKDQELSIRFIAAEGLGEVGGKKSLKPLVNALHDPDSYVQQAARTSLAHIQDRLRSEALDFPGSRDVQIALKDVQQNDGRAVEIDQLIEEMIRIALSDGLIGANSDTFDQNFHHRRAREIGIKIKQIGGKNMLHITSSIIIYRLGSEFALDLDQVWGGLLDQ